MPYLDMTVSKEEFTNRLLKVLGKRRRHSWGTALGFTNNRIHRLFKESEPLPSSEELALIGVGENLNLNWLIYGIGQMYRVQSYRETSRFNLAVENLASNQRARLYLIVCQNKCALITLESVMFEYKSKPISVRELYCLTGPGSSRLQAILLNHSIRGVEFPTHRFEELEAGELGTYDLFGDFRIQGYIEALEDQDPQWLMGNMPLAVEHEEIDLISLINCYNKIQSFKESTGQELNEKKIAELTWVMYQTELTEQHRSIRNKPKLQSDTEV